MTIYCYSVVLEYDGREYYGWQRLKDKPTIQGAMESAIEIVFGQRPMVQGAGRTDRGAHARAQVAGFRLREDCRPADLPARLNEVLPADIRVRSARREDESFHARSSAVGKEYEYRIFNAAELPADLQGRVWYVPESLDVEAMRVALPALIGRHDFASFATRPKFKQKSTVRDLRMAQLERQGSLLVFRFQADSFLTHMVRNLLRLIVKVGEGRVLPAQVRPILQAKNRAAAPGSAPASGLYLMRVFYPEAVLSSDESL